MVGWLRDLVKTAESGSIGVGTQPQDSALRTLLLVWLLAHSSAPLRLEHRPYLFQEALPDLPTSWIRHCLWASQPLRSSTRISLSAFSCCPSLVPGL